MQFITTILALAVTAFAAPDLSSRGYQCTFGQYVCSPDGLTIKQCDISGKFVVCAHNLLSSMFHGVCLL